MKFFVLNIIFYLVISYLLMDGNVNVQNLFFFVDVKCENVSFFFRLISYHIILQKRNKNKLTVKK